MKVTWTYDRGDRRDGHDVEVTSGPTLESLLRKIHLRNEPVVVTIYGAPDDPDDLPPGVQVGLGHPTNAFVAYIADDGGYLTDLQVPAPPVGISFDLGGVPTEMSSDRLRVRPERAMQVAVDFLASDGAPPDLH